MQKSGSVLWNNNINLAVNISNISSSAALTSGGGSKSKPERRLGLCSQIATGRSQHSSPIVFPEKRSKKSKASSRYVDDTSIDKANTDEPRVDKGVGEGIAGGGDEKSDLLGFVFFSGMLALDKKNTISHGKDDQYQNSADIFSQEAVEAKLTSTALIWGSHMVHLDDVISVSYDIGFKHFTVHSYPVKRCSCGLSCFVKPKRTRKDYCFLASSVEEALQWVGGFADQHCYVNCLPYPLVSSKKQASSELLPTDTPPELLFRCKSPPKMLVILNPRSGHGRSSKVFHEIVEPIFKLAGFKLEVVKTTSAGHARNLAANVDVSTCPDGIICVGGDGIINEVLNGLLNRGNQKEGISIPIGIIPAGSDNSLVWTVFGVRDPVSAAIAIVKGGITGTDVFAVEWIQTGTVHYGMTVSYYGFVSDVLELSEKYQKRFGPLRYFVAGFLKFLCLPKYSYEVEYLPASNEDQNAKQLAEQEVVDISDLYTDTIGRSTADGIPRASSLSSIDSMMNPRHMSGGDLDTTCSSTHASTEPSEYVRGLDPKRKHVSSGRNNITSELDVIHPQVQLGTAPNWPRTRSKSRTDKGWSGLGVSHDPSRCSWGNTGTSDREEISSTLSDPGPIWDVEPKWNTEHNWDMENPIELPGSPDDLESRPEKEGMPQFDDKWEIRKGNFLGILVCNHACKTVQSSQVVAPRAEHDDNCMDLLLVHGTGRVRLMRFFLLLQMGQHLSLPYVEYIKVKSVRIKTGKHTHSGCGIDGELFALNGQVFSFLLPEQCQLIGRSS
ncbi:hypothetical protein K2173_006780 [Erythroxylum novogranatense]|uniref:DAGKc domain-containing protein n=1 Tax=Erythroxylum novogranatense TaxID=1862640 RepID=A0AAV8SYZ8_9ROSI|nr:hypothetical protein K2173_006780 [Erythroxylum novogranatense]